MTRCKQAGRGPSRGGAALGPGLILAALATLLVLERLRPLRPPVAPPARRDRRNLAIAAGSAAAIRLVERPIVEPLACLIERRRWGLVPRLALPRWLSLPLTIVLFDYTLYLWHVLTHRVPLIWRFHLVHHIDRDLSASTALRFHAGEMLLSVPWRAAQVLLLGAGPRALSLWQTLTLIEILFHHSNVRLPIPVERWLVWAIVTPRMHGIHHSVVPAEMNANWSSGLTLWDRLHGTLRLDVPQRAITIGVAGYQRADTLSLSQLLLLPLNDRT